MEKFYQTVASKLYFMTRNLLVVGRVICLPCMECSAQPPADLKTIPALTEFKLCKTHGWLNSASNLSGKKGENWLATQPWLACLLLLYLGQADAVWPICRTRRRRVRRQSTEERAHACITSSGFPASHCATRDAEQRMPKKLF